MVYFKFVTSFESKRYFRPSIVIPVGLRVIVLDDVQPVGVVLDQSGSVSKVFSWNHLCPPSAFAWPPRNVVALEDTFWVSSPPDGDVVRVTVSGGATSVRREDTFPHLKGSTPVRYRFTASGSVRSESGTWQYVSDLEGTMWRSSVTFWPEKQPDAPHAWDLGTGSITGACAIGSNIFATVRRANKRPWEFRPKAEIISVDAASGQQTVLRSDMLDITSICWENLPQINRQTLEAKHFPHAVSQCLAIEELGAKNVGFMVSGLARDPRIDISFFHRSRPGVRCVRTDLLAGELGYEVGLLNLGISLEEDLEFGLIPPVDESVDGVLRV